MFLFTEIKNAFIFSLSPIQSPIFRTRTSLSLSLPLSPTHSLPHSLYPFSSSPFLSFSLSASLWASLCEWAASRLIHSSLTSHCSFFLWYLSVSLSWHFSALNSYSISLFVCFVCVLCSHSGFWEVLILQHFIPHSFRGRCWQISQETEVTTCTNLLMTLSNRSRHIKSLTQSIAQFVISFYPSMKCYYLFMCTVCFWKH